ncbi:MAG: phage antirepressor KilAC domain-containing protein [Synergistaceae bacterium]|nr:phage antirepressor KilAC domain-containing protein [Synergistaceae bacterium]
MSNAVQVFRYMESHEVRTTVIDGEVYFVGKDVASALGYQRTADAITAHVDEEDKLTRQFTDSGQGRDMTVINESGVYSLIFASHLPTAKQFKHWVTSEVLPSIRKSGMYLTEGVADAYVNNPELFAAMAKRCSALERKVEAMEKKLNERYSLSVLGETVLAQTGAISFKDGASFLSQRGVSTGQNRLFAYCRKNKLLCSRKGRQWNRPTQKAIDAGLFNVEISGGFNAITLITPRGLKYLTDKLIAEQYPLLVMLEAGESDD